MVPNITNIKKRAPGISKGLWKKELKYQLTGEVQVKKRSGKRDQPEDKEKDGDKKDEKKPILGKRKTSTMHNKNTSTFKTQVKKRQKK